MMRFANRTVVVTGAAAGIGLACAAAFVEEGANVVLADIDEEGLAGVIDAMPREFSKRAAPVVCDVTNPRQVAALMGYATQHFGALDALAACAGTVRRAPLTDVSVEDFERIVSVNLKGAFLCTQEAVHAMSELRDRGRDILGSIVLLGNDASFSGIPNILPHAVAAGGLSAMAKALARPLDAQNLRINTVGAGPADTGLLRAAVGTGKTAINTGLSRSAQQRVLEPEEIAKIVLFLASGDASAITGQTIGTGAD